mgnify:CR=1 FL=1
MTRKEPNNEIPKINLEELIDVFGNDLIAGKKFDNLVELKEYYSDLLKI